MIITITSITLKGPLKFLALANYARKIVQHMRQSPGFVNYKARGFWLKHYTVSAWNTEEDMRSFARSGAHAGAMQQTKKLAQEVSTYTYQDEQLPDWSFAKQQLNDKGKVIVF